MTVWKPAAFQAAMLRALSSKNTCDANDGHGGFNFSGESIEHAQLSLGLAYRSLGVELGDFDDSFHGLQRGLAQDPPAAILLLGWRRVQGLEADDPFEAVLEAELLQDSGRMGLVRVGENLHKARGQEQQQLVSIQTMQIRIVVAVADGKRN